MNEEVQQELKRHKRHADKLLTIFGSIFTGLFTVLVAAIFNLYQQEHRRFNELQMFEEKRITELRPMRQKLDEIAVRMEAVPHVQTDIRRLIDANLLTREKLLKLGNQIDQNREEVLRLNKLVKDIDDKEIADLREYLDDVKERKRRLKDGKN